MIVWWAFIFALLDQEMLQKIKIVHKQWFCYRWTSDSRFWLFEEAKRAKQGKTSILGLKSPGLSQFCYLLFDIFQKRNPEENLYLQVANSHEHSRNFKPGVLNHQNLLRCLNVKNHFAGTFQYIVPIL